MFQSNQEIIEQRKSSQIGKREIRKFKEFEMKSKPIGNKLHVPTDAHTCEARELARDEKEKRKVMNETTTIIISIRQSKHQAEILSERVKQ